LGNPKKYIIIIFGDTWCVSIKKIIEIYFPCDTWWVSIKKIINLFFSCDNWWVSSIHWMS
jgi:hypothetical protein